ncbi:hypothetical protein G7054_g14681 [Neopestalotiopsis clavispora]|nr:hypothetical protein G7054_g14681 [Neopestalotiopsis clavispora]
MESSVSHLESGSKTIDKKQNGAPARDTPGLPLQKRKRVTRACDECRRRKVQCNGKQPCTHCQVDGRECTYNQPSNRHRNPTPQYVDSLKKRLQRAEALLKKFMPDYDLQDSILSSASELEFRLCEQVRVEAAKRREQPSLSSQTDERLLPEIFHGIFDVCQSKIDNKNDNELHGPSPSTVFDKRKGYFEPPLSCGYQLPLIARIPDPSGLSLVHQLLSATGHPASRKESLSVVAMLPPKVVARRLCSYSIEYAMSILRVVHVPSFYNMLDKIYDRRAEHYGSYGTDEDNELALLYSFLALGSTYNTEAGESLKERPNEVATEEGFQYYMSAQSLLQDITECRNLISLQTLLLMILFLLSTSNLSRCYDLVGIAVRSAVQLVLLNEYDIDQPLPTIVDDEFITETGIISMTPNTTSFFGAFNAHAKLLDILNKVIKYIYPARGLEEKLMDGGQSSMPCVISHSRVEEVEAVLREWLEALPGAWQPNSEGPVNVVHIRNLLRLAFAHVQMVLYRPFLHAIWPKMTANKIANDRSHAYGVACVNAARDAVHIAVEMRETVSLVGPCWFSLQTEFLAIITLVFYSLSNADEPEISDIMADATAGKYMIDKMSSRSTAAHCISKDLEVLFDQLPLTAHIESTISYAFRECSATGSTVVHTTPSPIGYIQTSTSENMIDMISTQSTGCATSSMTHMTSGVRTDSDLSFCNDGFCSSTQCILTLESAANSNDTISPCYLDNKMPMHEDGIGLNSTQIDHHNDVRPASDDSLTYIDQPGFSTVEDPQYRDILQYCTQNIFDDVEGFF